MACTAVGNFPGEVPWGCIVELGVKIKAGASKGELLQIVAQITGQIGAMLPPSGNSVGAESPTEAQDVLAVADELLEVAPVEGAVSSGASVSFSLLVPLLLRLLPYLLK